MQHFSVADTGRKGAERTRGVIGSVYIRNHLLFSTLFLCDSDIVPTLLFTTRQVNNITTKSGEILGARGGGTSLDIGV